MLPLFPAATAELQLVIAHGRRQFSHTDSNNATMQLHRRPACVDDGSAVGGSLSRRLCKPQSTQTIRVPHLSARS